MSGPADPRRLVDAVEAADRALVDEDLITESDAERQGARPGRAAPRAGRR